MPRRFLSLSRSHTLLLQATVLVATVAALSAHVVVTWAVIGAVDRVVFGVDAAFALLAVLAATLHLQQLGRDRRQQRLVQALARALASPRDVAETALVAATLLVETGVATAAVVGVARAPGDWPRHGGAADGASGADRAADRTTGANAEEGDTSRLVPLARVGFPEQREAHDDDERPASAFGALSVQRERTSGDVWLRALGESAGERPIVARVPLRRGGELLGALILVSAEAGALGDRALLTAAAAMVATSLDNARLYQATLDQARDIEAQDARRREFLYAISHELRTPLTSIRAFSELLTEGRANRRGRRAQPLEEEELLRSLARGVDRMSDLVEDLLQLGRTEEVLERIELTAIDATLPLRAAESIIRPSFMQRQQALQIRLPATPVWVLGEARTLEQVLINLLSNANRHSPEGGPITVSLAADDAVARFEVLDSGPGIPFPERTRIFEPFYRVRQAGAPVPGSGLGLAIARRGVQQLNGQIWVDEGDATDTAGPGARFCVELPLAAAELVPATPSPETAPSRPVPRALQEAVDDATQLTLELHQRD